MASEFLAIKDCERLFELTGRIGLFNPATLRVMWMNFFGPSNEIRRHNLWNATGRTAVAIHVEIAWCRGRFGYSLKSLVAHLLSTQVVRKFS
jgi:hypothetical protein